MKPMEVKGRIDRIGSPGRSNFIGKKCLKFLEPRVHPQNTVSIVPIIGKYKCSSGFSTPIFDIESDETKHELF